MRPLTPEHRDQRDPYTHWLTDGQDQQLRHDLAQLPELVALVATHPQPIRQGNTGPRPQPGSRPPTPLTPITLLDRRQRVDDLDIIGASDLDRMAGGLRDGIAPTLHRWVIHAEAELLDTQPEQATPIPARDDVTSSCGWLLRHIVWILEQQWVTELAGAVRRMVRACEQHLHIRPAYRPRCPACHAHLDQHPGWWVCLACGREYRDERMMLAVHEPMTAEQIGRAFQISPATIRKWKERGSLPVAVDGPRPRYHVLDVLRLADDRGVSGA